MKIQVLGSGCPTCKKLFEQTKEAVAELKLKAEVEYSTDISKIIELGIMSSPVLVVDGKPVMDGAPGNIDKIKKLLTTDSSDCDCKDKDDCCGDDCDCNSKPEKSKTCSCGGNC